jgi:hypothetical protein
MLGGRGLVGKITGGLVDAGWVLGGEAGTNIIAGFIPATLLTSAPLQALAKVAAAVAVSWAAKKVSPNASKMALAGGLAAVIRGPVKAANLPLVSAALGDFYHPGYYAVSSYPQLPMASYPQTVGDADQEAYVQY